MIKKAYHGFLMFSVHLGLLKNQTGHTLGCRIWQNILQFSMNVLGQ